VCCALQLGADGGLWPVLGRVRNFASSLQLLLPILHPPLTLSLQLPLPLSGCCGQCQEMAGLRCWQVDVQRARSERLQEGEGRALVCSMEAGTCGGAESARIVRVHACCVRVRACV